MVLFSLTLTVVAATGSTLERVGDRYFNLGWYDQARTAYQAAAFETPALASSAKFLNRLGRVYFYSREHGQAAASFTSSFFRAATPQEKATNLIDLGRSLFALQDFTGADHYFSQVIKFEPRPPLELLYFFGLTCYEEGKATDAFNLFQNLYEQAGPSYDRDELRYLLGLCLMKNRSWAAAQFYLEGIRGVSQGDGGANGPEAGVPATGTDDRDRWFDEDARYRLALCDYYLGERAKAADLTKAFDRGSAPDRKMALLEGTMYLEDKDYDRALKAWSRILADPTGELFTSALLRTGYCYYQMGDYQRAVGCLDQLVDTTRDRTALEPAIGGRALFYGGAAYRQLGKPRLAAERYRALLSRYPGIEPGEEVQFRLADAYAAADDHQAAQAEFKKFLALFPGSQRRPEVRYRLARSLDRLERGPEALENLVLVETDSLLAASPASDSLSNLRADAYYLAGSILLNLKRYPEARESFAMVGEGPLRPRALQGLGDALFGEGEYRRAVGAYRQALAAKPDARFADDIRYQIEVTYLKMGVYGSELDVLRNYIRKYPTSPKSPGLEFELGVQLYERKNYRSAIAEAERLLRNYPGNELAGDALELMGRSYSHLNQVQAAIDAFQRVINEHRSSPVVPRVLEELGRLYAASDRPADALETYDRLVRLYPDGDNVGPVLLEIGRLYRRLEEWREARVVLVRFITRYSKSDLLRDGYLELIRVYEGQSDWRSAERLVGEFIEKFGPAGDGYWEWAVIEQSQGRFQQAKDLYIRASELFGANRDRSAQALLEAGGCAQKAGLRAEAKDLYVRVDILAFDERLRIEAKRRLAGLEP